MPIFFSFKRLSPLGPALLILIMVLILYPVLPPAPPEAHAAITRYASPSGSGTACTSSSPCSLQTAINQAVPGDTVTAADGTYSYNYSIGTNAGTSGSPILLKSTNLHGAIIQGPGPGGCNPGFNDPTSFFAGQPWWIIEGFTIQGMCIGLNIGPWPNVTDHVEVRNNIVQNYERFGILGNGNSANIHHNVIAFGFGDIDGSLGWNGISGPGNNSTVRANWIYGVGNRKNSAPCCQAGGYAMEMGGDNTVTNALVQGNVFLDASKGLGVRIFGELSNGCVTNPNPSCGQSTNNTVRDNIFALGAGGPQSFTENASQNTATNNVFYGVAEYTGPAAKGNDPGGNVYTHNTMIYDQRSSLGMSLECGSEVSGVCSRASVVQNNLYYSTFTTNNRLLAVTNQGDSIATKENNLFWQPGSTNGYVNGYTFAGSDITGSQPSFVNEGTGDYRLAAGSPGKGTASDGTDRGANFNSDLRIDWMQAIVQFPTAEKTVSGQTSASFNSSNGVDTSHYYQVWGYVKESSPYTGTDTTNVEGVVSDVAIGDTNVGYYNLAPPNRYIYLSTAIATDGTLNISWGNGNSFDKVFIRRLPTAQEAYTIMTGSASPTPTPTPTPSGCTPVSYLSPTPVLPTTIQLENYDKCSSGSNGEGITYHDMDAGNQGGLYRPAEGIDLYTTTATGGGYIIGIANAGEWTTYTATVPSTGTYTASVRIASAGAGGAFHLEQGTNRSPTLTIPTTNGWDTWTNLTTTMPLNQGSQPIRLVMDSDGSTGYVGNFNYLSFTQSGGPTACHLYTPSTSIPTGFGSPYDVVSSPSTNLMNVTCDTTSATINLGKADPLQYIYHQGYLFKTGGSNWITIPYTSTESLIASAWYPKSANATIALTQTELANPSYNLAYICSWTGSQWKCGCRDAACTQSYWEIQSFKR